MPVELKTITKTPKQKKSFILLRLWDEAEESLGSTKVTPYQGIRIYYYSYRIDAGVEHLINVNVSFTSDDIIILKERKEVKISITLSIQKMKLNIY